jgi:hypothetical protein
MSSRRRLGWFAAGLILAIVAFTRVFAENVDFTLGSKRMAARIDAILASQNPLQTPFRNVERVAALRKVVAQLETQSPNSPNHLSALFNLSVELLRAGEMEDSLEHLEQIRDVYAAAPKLASPSRLNAERTIEALDYLRIGEVENCLSLHGPDACIFPFRPGAYHKKQRGSREAIRRLEQILRNNTNDLSSRWLMNLAYTTLGEYPDGVPPQYLIAPKYFESEYDIKRFTNIANPLGLEVFDLAGGVVADDFDNDGNLDLMTSTWTPTGKIHLFSNNGDGSFTEVTERAGLADERGGLNLISADYNNDGFLDVFILRGAWNGLNGHFPQSLLKNNGNGTFSDVTEEAKLLTEHPTQTAVWLDYDNDGWLDLFVGFETSPGDTNRCQFFHNNKDGTFTDVAPQMGLDLAAFVKGVTAGDYNNDGRMDLYLSCGFEENHLLRNDGPVAGGWKFTDVTKEAGVAEPLRSFPTWFFDFDNDGLLDIFVSGYFIETTGDIIADCMGIKTSAERIHLYRNKGKGTFENVAPAMHIDRVVPTMGCNYGDLDNDGFLDFYLATGNPNNAMLIPNRMFRNDGGKRFQDVTTSGGFGHLQKGHAVAFADFDNDGDQDVYAVLGGAYTGDTARNVFFENPGHGNNWVKLKLEGVQSNRSAIGARIKLIVQTAQGERAIYRTVSTGSSFGTNPLRQEIGIADASKILRAEIFWPVTGKTQVIDGLQINHAYHVKEGAAKADELHLKTVRYAVAKHES